LCGWLGKKTSQVLITKQQRESLLSRFLLKLENWRVAEHRAPQQGRQRGLAGDGDGDGDDNVDGEGEAPGTSDDAHAAEPAAAASPSTSTAS
jgi:hypothetical protein